MTETVAEFFDHRTLCIADTLDRTNTARNRNPNRDQVYDYELPSPCLESLARLSTGKRSAKLLGRSFTRRTTRTAAQAWTTPTSCRRFSSLSSSMSSHARPTSDEEGLDVEDLTPNTKMVRDMAGDPEVVKISPTRQRKPGAHRHNSPLVFSSCGELIAFLFRQSLGSFFRFLLRPFSRLR